MLGYKATNELAQKLVSSPDVNVGFFVNGDGVATSTTVAIEASPLVASVKTLSGPELAEDCRSNAPIDVPASGASYRAIAARLPGEAGKRGAFFAVFTPEPAAIGFMATIKQVTKSDLAPGEVPWPLVGGGFVLALAIGIALMLVESGSPAAPPHRGQRCASRRAKRARLSEDKHGGKFGSIARSINIHIDKLARENKSAKKDFDQLLGPAPEGSLGTIDLLAAGVAGRAPDAAPTHAAAVEAFKFKAAQTAPGVPVAPVATYDSGPALPRTRAVRPPHRRARRPPGPAAGASRVRRRRPPTRERWHRTRDDVGVVRADAPRRRHPRLVRLDAGPRRVAGRARRPVLQVGVRPVPRGEEELQRGDDRPHATRSSPRSSSRTAMT